MRPPPPQYLQRWVAHIEALGFSFLRHATLERSHALAFVTRLTTAAEDDALANALRSDAAAAPAMRMRSEDRSLLDR